MSTLYLTGLGLERRSEADGSVLSARSVLQPGDPRALSRRLAPPAGGKQGLTRPVHPDQMVLLFSLAVPVFLYAIFTSQPGSLLPVLGVVAVFYGFYFWQRKGLVKRFNEQQTRQRSQNESIQRGVRALDEAVLLCP